MLHVMDLVMTGQTRQVVGAQLLPHIFVRRRFFEHARSGMAVQAFTIVVRLIQRQLCRDRPEIVDIKMLEPMELGLGASEHGVMRVTAVTCGTSRDTIVLEVRGREIGGIVNAQTFSVGLHRMARQTEVGGFGIFEMYRRPQSERGDGQNKQGKKGKHLAAAYGPERRPNDQQTAKKNAQQNEHRHGVSWHRLFPRKLILYQRDKLHNVHCSPTPPTWAVYGPLIDPTKYSTLDCEPVSTSRIQGSLFFAPKLREPPHA